MSDQVITISQTGEVTSLRTNNGKGLDISELGMARVERVSDIVHIFEAQRFGINLIMESAQTAVARAFDDWVKAEKIDSEYPSDDYPNMWIRYPLWYAVMGYDFLGGKFFEGDPTHDYARLTWATYEEAVTAEVAFLNALRLKGYFTK